MTNSRTRSINYTPRMSQNEAYDRLHPEIRAALCEATIEWDSLAVLNYTRTHNRAATIEWIREGDATQAARPWIPARGVKGRPGYVPAVANPCHVTGVAPQGLRWTRKAGFRQLESVQC